MRPCRPSNLLGDRPAGREREADRRALLRLALDRELAAVGEHQVLDDREPEPRPAALSRARLVRPAEPTGNPRQARGRYPSASVGGAHTGSPALRGPQAAPPPPPRRASARG